MGGTNEDLPAIGLGVVEPPRDGDAARIRPEVVVVDQDWRGLPGRTRVLEAPDQLPLLGVDADGRPALALKSNRRRVRLMYSNCWLRKGLDLPATFL